MELKRWQTIWQRLQPGQWLAVTLVLLMVLSGAYGIYQAWPQDPAPRGSFGPFSSRAEYDAFYRQHPILNQNAPLDAPFSVTSSVSQDKRITFVIHLFAPAIKPDNPASVTRFIQALRDNQQAAKNWLASHGEDPNRAYVVWSPDPAHYQPQATPRSRPPIPPHTMAHD